MFTCLYNLYISPYSWTLEMPNFLGLTRALSFSPYFDLNLNDNKTVFITTLDTGIFWVKVKGNYSTDIKEYAKSAKIRGIHSLLCGRN